VALTAIPGVLIVGLYLDHILHSEYKALKRDIILVFHNNYNLIKAALSLEVTHKLCCGHLRQYKTYGSELVSDRLDCSRDILVQGRMS
jgi:hypothetical protein